MKIYYDYQILFMQKYGGISRYYYDLISAVNECGLASAEIHCKYNMNHYFENTGDIKLSDGFFNVKPALLRRALRLYGHRANQFMTKRYLKRNADILHMTYYSPYALNWKGIKKVITVYDMIQEVFQRDREFNFIIENKRKCIYGADHIIAISENTKKDILRLYPDIDESKISVIYIGSSLSKLPNSEKGGLFPDKYILFVGRRDGYKNFLTFYKAVAPLLETDKELRLVCVGGDAFTADELYLIGRLKDRVLQFNIEDEKLSMAYSNALCFVFPSLYEGFGIPTLEAFACDCPVILSNTSSMPEVGGDAVLYFNPENEEEIRTQIKKVIYNQQLRAKLTAKGRERIKNFLWDKIAKETVDCYKNVLENG